MIFWEFYGR
jgi:hypothetical protein